MKTDFTFRHIGEEVKRKKEQLGISQNTLARSLGYKNGQFISNVERGLCSIPASKIAQTAKELDTTVDSLINSIVEDTRSYLKRESERVAEDEGLQVRWQINENS